MLRDFAPKSLYGRTILIVVLPLFIMQSVITWVFFNRHWEEVTASLTEATASDIGHLVLLWQNDSNMESRSQLVQQARTELDIEMGYVANGTIPTEGHSSTLNALTRTLDRALDWSLDFPYWYDSTGLDDKVETQVQLANGYLVFTVPRARVVAHNGHFFVLWLIGATLLLGYIALIFLGNQVRSITRLAAAADAFGRGEDVHDFKPAGAREVRQAGHAFIAMRARIRRFLEQRTEMLAGVSHDLKTPLTRMKLNLALRSESEDNDELRQDILEMERLLNDYLTFARGEVADTREDVNISVLAANLARSAERQSRTLELDVPAALHVKAQRSNLHRALTNLIENALKFGQRVRLVAVATETTIHIAVEDDGPGIAPQDRDAAIKAFGRLDQARNTNIPGSGLGLSIVRDVARAHGGTLKLETSELGGLRAVISLPIAQVEDDHDNTQES